MKSKKQTLVISIILIALLCGCHTNVSKEIKSVKFTMPSDTFVWQFNLGSQRLMNKCEELTEAITEISKIDKSSFWSTVEAVYEKNEYYPYEIYSTDDPNYALVIMGYYYKNVYWVYRDGDQWIMEDMIASGLFEGGFVDNVEFHQLPGIEKTILVLQDSNNQGNGGTTVYQIVDNRLEYIGFDARSVQRCGYIGEGYVDTSFWGGEIGAMEVAFQDINQDGKEEFLLYGRELNYAVRDLEAAELLETEIVNKCYQYVDDHYEVAEDLNFDSQDLLHDTLLQSYYLYRCDSNRFLVEKTLPDKENQVFLAEIKEEEVELSEIEIVGNVITDIEIEPGLHSDTDTEGNWIFILEQTGKKGRTYQLVEIQNGKAETLFVDEYRNYPLQKEESYLLGTEYNTYSCHMNDDKLCVQGSLLVVDENGHVSGKDYVDRTYEFVDGEFSLSTE